MNAPPAVKDLVALVADGQMEFTLRGLLARGQSLRFRKVSFDIYPHPEKDPGCLLRGHEFLRPFSRQYSRALVMLDCEGCGREGASREALEAEIESRLASSGWKDRSAAVAIDPELEAWIWSDSPEVDAALGWAGRAPTLVQWLLSEGFLAAGERKPKEPKQALEEALRIAHKGRSSAIYHRLAQRVSVHRCVDPAFQKLALLLRRWFGTSDSEPE